MLNKTKSSFLKKTFFTLFILFWIGATGWLAMQYYNVKKDQQKTDSKALLKKLSNHLILPEGEPFVATVTDASKIKKEQPFFKNAENGDTVVIWKEKALIYRTSADRIIDFGFVIRNANTTPTPAPTVTTTPVPTGKKKPSN